MKKTISALSANLKYKLSLIVLLSLLPSFFSWGAPQTKPGRIALVQYTADRPDRFGDKEKIRMELTAYFDKAVQSGANIIVFPEGSSFGYEEHSVSNFQVKKETMFDRKRTWCSFNSPTMEAVFAQKKLTRNNIPQGLVDTLVDNFNKTTAAINDLFGYSAAEKEQFIANESSKDPKEQIKKVTIADMVTRYRKEVFCVNPNDIAEVLPSENEQINDQWETKYPTLYYWHKKAKAHQVYLVVSVLEKVPVTINQEELNKYANTALVFGPQGYIAKHRKASRWQNEEYLNTILGSKPTIIETEYGKFGISICAGIFNRSVSGEYVKAKVDALLFPSDWVEKSYEGFKGFSEGNSFNFLVEGVANVNIFSADDNGSRRTGYFPVVPDNKLKENGGDGKSDQSEIIISDLEKDGILLLDFDFSSSKHGDVKRVHSKDSPKGEITDIL